MTVQPTLFTQIFELWPDDRQCTRFQQMALDMRVPRMRARQWIARDYLPPWYWPRLVDVLEQKFGSIVTYHQLVEATVAQRGHAMLDGQARGAKTRRRNREADGQSEAA